MVLRPLRTFVAALLAVGLLSPAASATAADAVSGPRHAPAAAATSALTARKLALGVSMLPYDDLVGTLDQFTQAVGRAPAIWSVWCDWGGGNAGFPTVLMDGLRQRGVVPMVLWQPVDPTNVNSPNFTYAKIIAGEFDTYIRDWAEAAKAWGGIVILRFAHEMDGAWFPWGYRRFDNTATRFKDAWRYIWTIFRGPGGAGATNVKFLWSPLTPRANLYPGDKYVDYVGFTWFNWGPPTRPWTGLLAGIKDKTARMVRITSKPIILAETGSTAIGGDKVAWISQGYKAVYRKLPKIKAIVYFDVDMTFVNQPDWRLSSPSGALAAYRALVAQPQFQGGL